MKKRNLILLSTTLAAFILFAFKLTTNPTLSIQKYKTHPIDSTTLELENFGINGGITIDIRTGLKTEYIANTTPSDLNYMVRGYSNRGFYKPITRQKLTSATSISDLFDNYPESWIKAYNSIVISEIGLNENKEATGSNAMLTVQQKEILRTASEVHLVQNRQMNTSFIVIPEVQAQFEGGYEKMITYLKENSQNKINNENLLAPQPVIYFVVNHLGKVEQTKIKQTSGDTNIDNLLLKVLTDMPLWTPAKDGMGNAVEQMFALDIGNYGC